VGAHDEGVQGRGIRGGEGGAGFRDGRAVRHAGAGVAHGEERELHLLDAAAGGGHLVAGGCHEDQRHAVQPQHEAREGHLPAHPPHEELLQHGGAARRHEKAAPARAPLQREAAHEQPLRGEPLRRAPACACQRAPHRSTPPRAQECECQRANYSNTHTHR